MVDCGETLNTEHAKSYIEIATFILAAVVCAIVPLISFPKLLIDTMGYILAWDFFVYYKSIAYNIITIAAIALLIFSGVQSFKTKDMLRIKLSLLLFTLWVAVSTCFATDFKDAFFGNEAKYQGLLSYIEYFIIFLLVFNRLSDKYIKLLVYITLASSSLISILCLFEFYGIDVFIMKFNVPPDFYFPTKVHATFGNSNYVGSYFSIMSPLSIVAYLRSKKSSESFNLLLLSVTNYAGLVVSLSRISWISVLVAIIFCLIYIDKNRLLYVKTAILIIIMFTVTFVLNATSDSLIKEKYVDAVKQFDVTSTKNISSFGSSRFYIYEKFTLLTFSSYKNMFFGVGPDCLSYYGRVQDDDIIKYPFLSSVTISKAHSDLIEYMASMGIPALIFYSWFIVSILFSWLKKFRTASPEMSGIFAAWLGYLIQSLFNMSILGVIAIFFVFSAIIVRKPLDMTTIRS